MNQKRLLKISIAGSLFGLLALLIISELSSIDKKSLDQSIDGDYTKLTGIVSKVNVLDKVIFVELIQAKPETVVIFTDGNLNLSEGDRIFVTGRADTFKGKKQLIADEVRKVS